ncbi:MAG: hypothetical protein IRZ14_04070 [Chloroflexi bacterium]|nr:hypothetical protein [Chloroflexota bacterium]
MMSRRGARTVASVRRHITALGLLGLLLPWTAVLASPAHAQWHGPEPVARLQLVVNYVTIYDDGDWWGAGEFTVWARVDRYLGCQDGGDPLRDGCGVYRGYVGESWQFSASSGSVHQLDRVMPSANSDNRDRTAASSDAGIGVRAGEVLALRLGASESDPLPDMGFEHGVAPAADLVLRERDGWSVGRHSQRLRYGGFDITVVYEVRRTPLPDLVPHNLRQFALDDGRPVVCPSALNQGQRPSGPFQIALQVDGAVPTWGTFPMPALAVSEVSEHCFLVDTLPPGPHRFVVLVDAPGQVAEMNEANNRSAEQTIALQARASQPSPTVGPAVAPERPRSGR